MNFLVNALLRIACFCGFHHMHDLNDKEVAIRTSAGLKVDGEYCCRCHKIVIKRVRFKGEDIDNPKIKKIEL